MTYFDTHAAVWLYAGLAEQFSPDVLAEIETAELRISPAVLLEIRLLQEIRRIEAGPYDVLPALQRDIGLTVCPIPFHQVIRAAFEESWTRDPFDRLIVAQAKAGKGKLISKDRAIRAAYRRPLWCVGPIARRYIIAEHLRGRSQRAGMLIASTAIMSLNRNWPGANIDT
ncbi:MAG TPA: PIN domain-containing protein [Bryobacteraceae bacterium]